MEIGSRRNVAKYFIYFKLLIKKSSYMEIGVKNIKQKEGDKKYITEFEEKDIALCCTFEVM